MDFKHRRHIRAADGEPGQSTNKFGKCGQDAVVRLPVGTLVRDAETGEILADLVAPGQEILFLKGGLGGRGNAKFASSTNRTPTYAQPGLPGEERRVRLELKLLADVGLLGFPNAGKSTLISRISAARPKIADYPFTTLIPNLGVVSYGDGATFVVTDIPGLIEGASDGAGLGIRFLKHVERTRLLLHLIDGSDGGDPLEKYRIIRGELEAFDPELALRPERVVLTKIDVTEVREAAPEWKRRFAELGLDVFAISAVTGEGLTELVRATGRMVEELRAEVGDGEDEADGAF